MKSGHWEFFSLSVWTLGVSRAPQAMLLCSNIWEPLQCYICSWYPAYVTEASVREESKEARLAGAQMQLKRRNGEGDMSRRRKGWKAEVSLPCMA